MQLADPAPVWLYEEGIGENRAILVDGDEIVEAAIELPNGLVAGGVHEAQLTQILGGVRGIVSVGKSGEALLERLPAALTQGQTLHVEIVREAIAEPGRAKLAKCRATDGEPHSGPGLLDRISATSCQVQIQPAHGLDRFEQAGWSELLEEAGTGEMSFPGGALRLSLTPAMTLFDVDGDLPGPALAAAGAEAAARAIRRLGISGSIGIDLPTMASRDDRQRAAAALDAVLPQPFERTAVNGFGFLQVVRKRERASLPELVQYDRTGAAARALLRRAERATGPGALAIHAAPGVIRRLEGEAGWLEILERRTGGRVHLHADPSLQSTFGHVQKGAP
jgi:hypothetical protein